ncbi:MAG TPA: hypothetical protein VI685_19240 [Candidatus Angelobacter sp.]
MRLMTMRFAKLFALLLFLSLSSTAQTPFPDTPAGHPCGAWLEAFNQGDRET